MPYTPVTAGLYTTVENTSGVAAVFGFLGLHGKRLLANETFTVPGDLVATLGGQRGQRKFKALEAALTGGDLRIISSPAVYLKSNTDDTTAELALQGRVLGTIDPGWDPAGTGVSDWIQNDD